MATGVVKMFNTARGFGFILPDEGGKDVFFHVTALEKSGIKIGVREGDRVVYEVDTDERTGKLAACDIAPE